MNYLKIGKATDLEGRERKIYRLLEGVPGFLSWGTLLGLIILSYFKPVWVAYFIIAFDVYWLLLVLSLALYLLLGFKNLKKYKNVDWKEKCQNLRLNYLDVSISEEEKNNLPLCDQGMSWTDIYQLIILPNYNEDVNIIRTAIQSLLSDDYPRDKMIVVLAMEERAGAEARARAEIMTKEFKDKFGNFLITFHPDGIVGEIKGKGANQAHAAKIARAEIIDRQNIDYNKVLVSVFDIDTIIHPGYFYSLCYTFLTVKDPYHASYQPVPLYHNNIWQAPFFARVASSSNTFWQLMQQIRPEKLATYSSHSMTFKALVDIGFWSVNMVSEDSRIFWNCLLFYNGRYRVEPMYFPVYMDTTMDRNFVQTVKSLYKQQRRWAWGSENVPYLLFNTARQWKTIDRKIVLRHIFIQIYGFHSWATNALIIGVIGWLPMLLGGDRFNATVLSGNLPVVTTWLMNLAMVGMIQSAVIANMLLPKKPKGYSFWKNLLVIVEWIFVPVSIIIFGSIPCLDAQTRLIFGKYMGFWVTPKSRE